MGKVCGWWIWLWDFWKFPVICPSQYATGEMSSKYKVGNVTFNFNTSLNLKLMRLL